jgi:hypothetical protein
LIAAGCHAVLFMATAAALNSFVSLDVGAVLWSHRYYYDYASQALAGKIPYRDFVFEYPILSFPLFLVPRLLVSDFQSYRVAFVVEMYLFDLAAIVLIAWHDAMRHPTAAIVRRLSWYTGFCFLLSPLVIGRFELAPMALAFAGAHWWFSGRASWGGITAGLGTLMKVFPGLVVAPALVCEASHLRKSQSQGMECFLATLTIGLVFWLGLGGRRVIESLGYHTERGLEVECLFGGILFLAGAIKGSDVSWIFDHNSYHVSPEWGAGLAALTFPLQAVSILAVMWRFWRTGMSDGVWYSTAALLAFIVFGKVLSPQYLIWLFPFVAVLSGHSGSVARKIFLLSCLATALLYPGPGFNMVLVHKAAAILLLNLRNVFLLWLLGVLLLGPRKSTCSQALSEAQEPDTSIGGNGQDE